MLNDNKILLTSGLQVKRCVARCSGQQYAKKKIKSNSNSMYIKFIIIIS